MELKMFCTQIPRRPYPQAFARCAAGSITVRASTVPDAKGACMTLLEISRDYEASAALLRQRLKELRQMMKTEKDPEKLWHIRRRIIDLTPMLTEMNELADLTAHYYDRGYWRNEKYTV